MAKRGSVAAAATVHSPLSELLETLVVRCGSRAALIKRAEITQSQLSHWMNPLSRAKGPGVAACCRLARAGECSLAHVFHAAGLHEYGTIVEELYGHRDGLRRAFRAPAISASELSHLADWRKLTAHEQKIYTTLIKYAIKHAHIVRAAAMNPASQESTVRAR